MKKIILNMVALSIFVSTTFPSISLAAQFQSEEEAVLYVADTDNIDSQFSYLTINSLDKNENLSITQNQQERVDSIIDNAMKKRVLGIDDVIAIITVVGFGYAGGKYAGKQANKRFGLTAKKYKANRWWWRGGISAVAGVPAALGFDDYFYGI